MAYTTPRTWSVGETVTAAMLNEQIRDNEGEIWKGTTAGDLDYYTSGTAKTRLAIGATGDALVVVSGAPAWQGYVGASVSQGVAKSISNNTVTVIDGLGTTGAYDKDPLSWLSGGNTITIGAGYAGIYHISASGYFSGHASAGTQRELSIFVAAVNLATQTSNQANNGGVYPSTWLNASWIGYLAAGSAITVKVLQVSTAAVNFQSLLFGVFKVK